MGYAIVDLVEQYKLSMVYSDKGDVWHVISPFVDKDTPRFSATNAVLRLAVAEVILEIRNAE